MAEEVEMDQKVYDELIAQGKSERIARAKAKSAAVRAKKEAAGETLGPREASAAAPAPAAAAAAGGGAAGAAAPAAGVATAERGVATGGMTPEERQKRVAAALAAKGNGNAGAAPTETKFADQAHTHRLLAMVPPAGIQQIRAKQEDKVYTWPHLISAEFVALLACTALLTVLSTLPAFPLRELANPNVTPNPSKAPWYFLGLQELLRYFHPMVAGVTIPGIVGLLGLMTIPYLDKNPSVRPENRKTAFTLMTFFLLGSAMMTMVGSFFRGPGFNWVWPWIDGLFFEL